MPTQGLPMGVGYRVRRLMREAALPPVWRRRFFQNLRDPALNKAQALQRAQQHLLAQRDYQHSFYWVPFLLIGNWR